MHNNWNRERSGVHLLHQRLDLATPVEYPDNTWHLIRCAKLIITHSIATGFAWMKFNEINLKHWYFIRQLAQPRLIEIDTNITNTKIT